MRGYFVMLLCVLVNNSFSQVGIGTTNPSPASMLEVSSQTNGLGNYKGFMPPRVPNEAARDAINATSNDYGLLVFVESISCLQIWDSNGWSSIFCRIPKTEPWINEFHYDNEGVDEGEFVEIAGEAGIDLSNYNIELYNGASGKRYKNIALRGIIPRESNNYGAISFEISGIQNGGPVSGQPQPDGIALVKGNAVIMFISYEGSFEAINGAAAGMVSTNIGVEESNDTTPIGHSLRLTGHGNKYSHFRWQMPAPNSPGSINQGQTIQP